MSDAGGCRAVSATEAQDHLMRAQPLTWALWLLERWLRAAERDPSVGDVASDTRRFVDAVDEPPIPFEEIRVCADAVLSEFTETSPLTEVATTVKGWLLVTPGPGHACREFKP